jgi:hypothetical protein
VRAIKEDNKLIVRAASQAGAATELVLAPHRQAEVEPEAQDDEPQRDEAADLAIMRAAMACVAGRDPEAAA